jgi:hypothetical protein
VIALLAKVVDDDLLCGLSRQAFRGHRSAVPRWCLWQRSVCSTCGVPVLLRRWNKAGNRFLWRVPAHRRGEALA